MTDAAYYGHLQAALRSAGAFGPSLIIDLDRLDGNIGEISRRVAPGKALRIVDKSLPCAQLMRHILTGTQTDRIMSFHLPVTRAMLAAFPQADILLGKPVPADALRHALDQAAAAERDALSRRVVWLIDTTERLEQYAALAAASAPLRIAFEIDIGMHRGGFASPDDLTQAIALLQQMPQLSCEGVMGYEAHIPAIPWLFGGQTGEMAKTNRRLAGFVDRLPSGARAILNTGGSTTTLLYDGQSPANEVSIGSAFVLPADFDTARLTGLLPACFIATPILKVLDMRLPGPIAVTRLMQALGRFPRRGCFLLGGKWMAKPVYPDGMTANRLWGDSSNQQFMALPAASIAAVDDHAFFRPTQSETMLQQFGPLLVYSQGRIIDAWPVLPPV